MISFDNILKLNGFPINEAKNKLMEIQRLDKDRFESWRKNQLNDILKFHFENNLFYRNRILKGKLPSSWEEIPIVKKSDFQEDIKKIITGNFSKRNIKIHNTSGSSGHPFFFAKDKFCHAMTWSIIQDRYARHNISLNNKQARFYGIPLTIRGNLKEKIKDKISNRIRFPVFNLADNILESFLKKFQSNPIDYIYGYTSSIALFAKFILEKGINLKNVCPSLLLCIVTSEVCTPEERNIIEKAFGVKVVNEYGAAELDFIAFEDEDFDWIITNESLFVEILKENNFPVEIGEPGKIVVTSLFNKAMPFIRYEIGDYGTISTARKGNYQILKNLLGRTNDFAILPSGKKSPGLTFYYISKSILEKGSAVKEFIIRQTALDKFVFEYVSHDNLSLKEQKEIKHMMNLYLEPGLTAYFKKKESIIRPVSGKLKHFYSEIGLNITYGNS